MNKKGIFFNRETMFIAMGVLVGALAILGMLSAAAEVLDTNALFKKHLARDLALIIGAVYAAPGEVTYNYPMDPGRTYYVRVNRDEVLVSSEQDFREGKTFSYRIADDENVGFEFFQYGRVQSDMELLIHEPSKFPEDLATKPINVTIEKLLQPSSLPNSVVKVGFKR